MYDIIIIGAGPAGLSAAIYAARAMKKVLVLEANSYGGQIINSSVVENYPGVDKVTGYEFASKLYNQAKNLGAEIVYEEVTEILDKNTIKTAENVYLTKSIIIATGLKQRKLGLYGENELIGKGISYCATCDGAFFKNQNVAVIGSGATAVEDALYLSNIADKVYLVNRSNRFKCDELMLHNLNTNSKIEILYNESVKEIIGEDTLTGIVLSNDVTIKISGLFIAIGYVPSNSMFKGIVKLDKNGFIKSNDTKTNVDNIFVAGDTRTKTTRQLITAASDGAIAVQNALEYLNKNN